MWAQENPHGHYPEQELTMTSVVSWNINAQRKPWQELFRMDADVALLQEVKAMPKELPAGVVIAPSGLCEPWEADLFDRWPMIVKLSNRVEVEWFRRVLPIRDASERNGCKRYWNNCRGPSTAEGGRSFCRELHVRPMDQAACFHWIEVESRLRGRFGAPDHLGPVRLYRPR